MDSGTWIAQPKELRLPGAISSSRDLTTEPSNYRTLQLPNHHAIFHYIRKGTLGLIWINLLFLLFVCFVPFPTTLLVDYPKDQFSVVIYGGAHVLASSMLVVMWRYLIRRPELIRADERLIRRTTVKLTFVPLAYLPAIGLSFLEIWIGVITALGVPIIHVLMDHTNLYQFGNEEAGE